MLRIRMLAAAIVAAGTLAIVAAPTGAAAGAIKPVLQCVFVDTKTGTTTAVWGYTNTTGAAADIPVGGDNRFDPTPQDRGQPTRFDVGTQTNVFTTTWEGTNLTWRVNGTIETASHNSKACESSAVPQGTDSSQAFLLIAVAAGVVMVASAASGWMIHRRRSSV
jgi:hypothetical protein